MSTSKSVMTSEPSVRIEIGLDAEKFSFIGYSDQESMFRSQARPYRIIRGNPGSRVLENAIYIPKTGRHVGCLYDEGGGRVDESCIFRGTNDLIKNVDPRTIKFSPAELPVHEGPALYLGFISKHYGHFLTESLSRAWITLGSEFEDLRCLVHVRDPSVLELPYIRRVFEALGVDKNRVLSFDRPTQVRKIVLPDVSFQANSHIYTAYRDTMQSIASACVSGRVVRTDQPLYVSRSQYKENRRTHSGEAEVEQYIRNRGGRIFHPQNFSIDEQILAFNRHRIIIGINGSAMHNLAFSLSSVDALQFAGNRVHPNYFLIDGCFGVRATYCRSLVESQEGYRRGVLMFAAKGRARLVKVWPFNLLRRLKSYSVPIDYQLDYDKAIYCIGRMSIFS